MARYVIQKSLLDENIETVKSISKAPIIGVVKADGYGFGMEFMASALREHGVKMFAITEIADIDPLRKIVGEDDILVMRSTAISEEIEPAVRAGCIATVGSLNALKALDSVASKLGVFARAHIKVDVGFSRYGFLPDDVNAILACFKCENVIIEGMYSHFSKAYADLETTRQQLDSLKRAAEAVRDAGFDPGMLHVANSAALFNFSGELDVQLDAVRVGSAFTGRIVSLKDSGLARVGYIEARVIDIKKLKRGAKVGYGSITEVTRDTSMAFVSAGIRDGFGLVARNKHTFKDALSIIKHLKDDNRLHVKIGEQTYPLIGEADLSTCYVDVTDGDVKIGDVAILDPNPLMVPNSVPREYI